MFRKFLILLILLLILGDSIALGIMSAVQISSIIRTEQSITKIERTKPIQPVPTAIAQTAISTSTNRAEDAKSRWFACTNKDGYFSVLYPADYKLYEDQILSVDGVMTPAPKTVTLQKTTEKGLLINIAYKPIGGAESTRQFAAQDDACVTRSPDEPWNLSGQRALLFKDTVCGPYGSTVIYMTYAGLGYRIEITSDTSYDTVKEQVATILGTFHPINQTP